MKHSIDKGLYIETDISIDEEKILKLKEKMQDLVSMNLPIPSEDIPSDSLLREFIGGSCFK